MGKPAQRLQGSTGKPKGSFAKPRDGNAEGGKMQAQLQHRNKVINRQISQAAETGNSARLFEMIHEYLPEMNGINLATAFHRVAKLAPSSERDLGALKKNPVFQELFSAILVHLHGHSLRGATGESECKVEPGANEMPVQCLSIVAWSCATLQIRHRSLFSTVADITSPRLLELKPYELSNLLWAFAKLGFSPCELFKSVVARLLRREEGEFKVQCLSTIAWAFATVKRRNVVVFGSIAKELAARASEMKPQEMSNALWAFARSRCGHAQLFQALGDAAAADSAVSQFKPQEISNTAWAFASVGLQHPLLFAKIEAMAAKRRREMMPQNVANILWAYAKLQLRPTAGEGLFRTLLQVSKGKLPQHKPQELSAIMWAISQVCPEEHSEFCMAAARCCVTRAQEFSCNGLANLVKALAEVRMEAGYGIYTALLREVLPRLPHFRTPALLAVLHGTATALRNPCYATEKAAIEEVVGKVSLQVAAMAQQLQQGELQELSCVVATLPVSLGVDALVQALATARASQADSPKAASAKSSTSLGSASTSAEESQEDEEAEDIFWPQDTACTLQGIAEDPNKDESPGPLPNTERFISECSTACSDPSQEEGWKFDGAAGTGSQGSGLGSPGCSVVGSPQVQHLQDGDLDLAPWHVPLPAPMRAGGGGFARTDDSLDVVQGIASQVSGGRLRSSAKAACAPATSSAAGICGSPP